MIISGSVRALLVVAALSPTLATAGPADGTIHFQGAIVDATNCRVTGVSTGQAPVAQLQCQTRSGLGQASQADLQARSVTTRVEQVVLKTDSRGQPMQYGRIVTLTYR
ncbi:type 1 fimbrial protein [Achromobacter sp. UMC71]|uniref:type 1 fimbrial protein n=1 Tax=Achromobacter sp. UMC71 TaxID=1862320 RepID=UPI001600D685|nr:type 1 fimbrial protein [Achromobacter sp. UMC71]MBB1627055.1 hypothetical protein [Achromobacter sp. UMC71]